MGLVKCPDCGKMISELAPACIGCGRPVKTFIQAVPPAHKPPERRDPPAIAPPIQSTQTPRKFVVKGFEKYIEPMSLEELRSAFDRGSYTDNDRVRAVDSTEWLDPHQLFSGKIASQKQSQRSVHELDQEYTYAERSSKNVPSNQEALVPSTAKKKDWSWKSFGLAFLLAFIINIVGAAASGGKPAKNIWWTVMWMYLSIEAWKYWKWKALLPYPLFGLVSVAIGLIMVGDNLEKMSWTYIVIKGTLNIGGLVAFYLALHRTKTGIERV